MDEQGEHEQTRSRLCAVCENRRTTGSKACFSCVKEIFGESSDVYQRRFVLYRIEDNTGVSGTGVVAVGVEFPSEKVVMEWLNEDNPNLDMDSPGLAMYDSLSDVREVHGHGGKSKIITDEFPEL